MFKSLPNFPPANHATSKKHLKHNFFFQTWQGFNRHLCHFRLIKTKSVFADLCNSIFCIKTAKTFSTSSMSHDRKNPLSEKRGIFSHAKMFCNFSTSDAGPVRSTLWRALGTELRCPRRELWAPGSHQPKQNDLISRVLLEKQH